MIGFKYINEELPYNRELDSIIGIDYANDGRSVRYDPVRVEVDNWIEEHFDVHECTNQQEFDCRRCCNNQGFDSEFIEIRVGNKTFSFVRNKSHQLGGVWSNWYDNNYAITPAK